MLKHNLPSRPAPAPTGNRSWPTRSAARPNFAGCWGFDPALAAEAERAAGGLPLLVPRPYLARIRPGDPADPLLLQVLPRAAEMPRRARLHAPIRSARPTPCCGPGLLRKYQGRILMVTTGACAVHCRFCFRRHFPYGPERDVPIAGTAAGLRQMGTGPSGRPAKNRRRPLDQRGHPQRRRPA